MSKMKNNEVKKVLDALAEDPSRMKQMLGGNTREVVRSVLNDDSLSEGDVSRISEQVEDNNVMKLFLKANGQIDPANLMRLTGGFEAKEEVTRASGIGALLDGKLDANDVIAVMNLMNGNSSSSSSTASPNLLSALFGSTTQPAQQPAASNGLLSLLGGGQQAQAQPQQQAQASGLGSLLGALTGQNSAAQAQPQTQTVTQNGMTVTLSGLQLAQIMQMFTKEQIQITQAQSKQNVTLTADQLKQTISKLGGKVQKNSKQTVTLSGSQLAAIMVMLGSGSLQITQAQMDQQITLNASQMNQLITSLASPAQAAAKPQAQNKPAAQAAQNSKPEGYGQVYSFGGNAPQQSANTNASSADLSSLMNLASLLMGKK